MSACFGKKPTINEVLYNQHIPLLKHSTWSSVINILYCLIESETGSVWFKNDIIYKSAKNRTMDAKHVVKVAVIFLINIELYPKTLSKTSSRLQ